MSSTTTSTVYVTPGGYDEPPPPGSAYNAVPPSPVAVPVFDIDTFRQQPDYTAQTVDRIGDWEPGLYDCFDSVFPNCCMVTLCPCVSQAQIFFRVRCSESYVGLIIMAAFGWIFTIGVCVLLALPIESDDDPEPRRHLIYIPLVLANGWVVNGLAVYIARRQVLLKFHIPGDTWDDLAVACFCSPCAQAQAASHAQSYTPRSCSFGKPDVLPPFE